MDQAECAVGCHMYEVRNLSGSVVTGEVAIAIRGYDTAEQRAIFWQTSDCMDFRFATRPEGLLQRHVE